jgi:hypothetical protein
MRCHFVILSVLAVGCGGLEPGDAVVSVEVLGTVTLEGDPTVGSVELWDHQYSDSAADDVRLAVATSDEAGRYQISTEVELAGCGNPGLLTFHDYELRVTIGGLVDAVTGEPRSVFAAAIVWCEVGQTVDFDVLIPADLQRPPS